MISIGGYFSKLIIIGTNQNNQRGLTLVEVLAALLLLCWLALSIPAIFSPVAAWIAKARLQTTAVNYAASMLEELRVESEKISVLNSGETAEELGLDCKSSYAGMTGRITMQPQQDLPDLYEVTATVYWSQAGQTHTMQLFTLIRKELR